MPGTSARSWLGLAYSHPSFKIDRLQVWNGLRLFMWAAITSDSTIVMLRGIILTFNSHLPATQESRFSPRAYRWASLPFRRRQRSAVGIKKRNQTPQSTKTRGTDFLRRGVGGHRELKGKLQSQLKTFFFFSMMQCIKKKSCGWASLSEGREGADHFVKAK